MTTPSDAVLTSVRGRVLEITLNRPDAMNAINGAMTAGLIDALAQLQGDPMLTVGILTGNGKGFCSGMDLKAFAREGPPRGLDRLLRDGASKPLIAAVEGFALAGGLELALICDIIVAADGATFGLPESKVGLIAAGGGLVRLAQRLPQGLAMEMALYGDPILANEALHFGLVARVAKRGEALSTARELADKIARNAPLAVAASKRLIRESEGRTIEEFWDHQRPVVQEVFGSEDAKEGPRSFAEKREPQWSGR